MASLADGFGAGPQVSLRAVFDAVESHAAGAIERLTAGEGFSELLVRASENAFALARIHADIWDLVLRNYRLAGLRDIERLARQMLRTEDKLEVLLQAVERMEPRSDTV